MQMCIKVNALPAQPYVGTPAEIIVPTVIAALACFLVVMGASWLACREMSFRRAKTARAEFKPSKEKPANHQTQNLQYNTDMEIPRYTQSPF